MVDPSAMTLTVSLPLPTRPATAGTVAVSRPTSVVRSTAPEPETRVVVLDEVVRVADTVKATEVADVEAAAAAPRAPRAEPGLGVLPPPKAPPKAAAPKAIAAISEAMMVATASRRAPPAAGTEAGIEVVGPVGGSSALTKGPGASIGARCSVGRTIRAVPVAVPPVRSIPSIAVGPVATKTPSRYSTESPMCAPSSCAERRHGPDRVGCRSGGHPLIAHGTEGGVRIIGAPPPRPPRAAVLVGFRFGPFDSDHAIGTAILNRPSGV